MVNPDFHSRRETRPEEGPSRDSLRADRGVHVGIAGRLHTSGCLGPWQWISGAEKSFGFGRTALNRDSLWGKVNPWMCPGPVSAKLHSAARTSFS